MSLFTFYIHHLQSPTVFVICYFLSVGRELRLLGCYIIVGEACLLDVVAITKKSVVFVLKFCQIYLPYAVAFRCVYDASAVRCEVDIAFLFRSIGNLFCSLVFNRSHVDVAVHYEGYLLSVWRNAYLCGTP